jgi:hypothetical protein
VLLLWQKVRVPLMAGVATVVCVTVTAAEFAEQPLPLVTLTE